jgi:uncharacterized protein
MLIFAPKYFKHMPRKKCHRHIEGRPDATLYKPAGIPMHRLEEVVLHIDEFEAIRLADVESLYHEEAATRMNISRQTFGRILEMARHKVADALTGGKAIIIENFVLNSTNNIIATQDENSSTNKGTKS